MQTALAQAVESSFEADAANAAIILLGVAGGLSTGIEGSRWEAPSLNKSVSAMLRLERSNPCSSLVLHSFTSAEAWRVAAGGHIARLHERRGGVPYERRLQQARGWLSLALRVSSEEPSHVAPLPKLREMQHALTELQRQARDGELDAVQLREMQDGQAELAVVIEKQLRRQQGGGAALERSSAPRWTTQALLPMDDELDATPHIAPNLLEGAYPDVDVYARTHFELLREDFLRPLREVLQTVREGGEPPRQVHLWRDVVLGAASVGEPGGALYTLRLSEEQFAALNVLEGKGVMNGSLLLLSMVRPPPTQTPRHATPRSLPRSHTRLAAPSEACAGHHHHHTTTTTPPSSPSPTSPPGPGNPPHHRTTSARAAAASSPRHSPRARWPTAPSSSRSCRPTSTSRATPPVRRRRRRITAAA